MRSTRLQLLVTLAGVLAASGFFAARGLPPEWSLSDAADRGDLSCVRQSLDWCPADVRCYANGTALMWAAAGGHRDVAALLVDRGAQVNVRDDDGWTPLHCAVSGGSRDLVKYLVAHGAEVDAGDGLGVTPLSLAARCGGREIAAFLIASGASVNTSDRDGLTPLHLAADNDDRGLAALLIAHGADVNARADDGRTPLAMALSPKERFGPRNEGSATTLLLRQHGANE